MLEESDAIAMVRVLKPIIERALGMKNRADHGVTVRLTQDEINAGKDALVAAGVWDDRVWETPPETSDNA